MEILKLRIPVFIICVICVSVRSLSAQSESNCFLDDFEPKTAVIPPNEMAEKTIGIPSVTVNLTGDTLGKISKYIYGNAWAVWMGNVTNDPVLIDNIQTLGPSLIRFPGGSWSNVFFWDGTPADVPDSIYNGITGEKEKFWPISGKNDWPTTTANYYLMREKTGAQGLITVNYGYARYGLGEKPAEIAAHMAAEWVRYDQGRTKFWEVGNENAGPWEAGWMIDTARNRDDQPPIVSGKLYGQHFNIIADSMRAAAAETGSKIYIGGQILHYDGTNSWNSVDKNWNKDFFAEVGDAADFYVMHNYFGTGATVNNVLSAAVSEPKKNIDFILQDISDKNAFQKPVAITEYNMNHNDANPQMTISNINGIQAVILFNEFIKNNYGLSARWLLATGESGMFYAGDNNNLKWQARPDFYYCYYQQKFTGDHAISASSDQSNILAYASRFASGETGMIIVNKGKENRTIRIEPGEIPVGEKYYTYTLTGGTDNGDFSLYVSVNDVSPSGTQWGPREDLENIPARSYSINDDILLDSPALSVQFVMLDSGDRVMATGPYSEVNDLSLLTCFPNPLADHTTIRFQTLSPDKVSLVIYNLSGAKVKTLINEFLTSGVYSVEFDGKGLPAGIYFCVLQDGSITKTLKIALVK